MFTQVKKTIERCHLLERGDQVVVGVSGGVDSMVLLHLLHSLREDYDLSLRVAHVNHGLRPEESKREAELVEKESNRLGLPYEYGQFDVRAFSWTAGLSLQDAARRIRFHFFRTLLIKYQAQKIALGHHADDQVETLLLRLFRGSGSKGLKGILPIHEKRLIHPLLETWRVEIESFAAEHQIPYLPDSSNLKKDYLRNRLRLDLIPLIEREYQSRFKEAVLRSAAILREEDDCLDREAEDAFQRLVHAGEEGLSFRYSEFQSFHSALQWRFIRTLLGRFFREASAEEEAWYAIPLVYEKMKVPAPSFLLELPHDICLEKRYNTVLLKKGRMKRIPPFEIELCAPGRTLIEELGKEVGIEEIPYRPNREEWVRSPAIAFLDGQKLRFPLKLRNFRPGDRFQPLGVEGEQKLKEFFIDHKVPRYERPEIPLLLSGETIVWVVGYRISEQVKITDDSKTILRIEVKKRE
jgi:tRNA(Ile)-lysidine synthase